MSKLRGRVTVLIYYQTASARTVEPVLRFAESLYSTHGSKAFIVPLAIGPNETALQQRNEFKLTVNVLAGREVYKQHAVEMAPCMVVIDQNGVVRKVAGAGATKTSRQSALSWRNG